MGFFYISYIFQFILQYSLYDIKDLTSYPGDATFGTPTRMCLGYEYLDLHSFKKKIGKYRYSVTGTDSLSGFPRKIGQDFLVTVYQ